MTGPGWHPVGSERLLVPRNGRPCREGTSVVPHRHSSYIAAWHHERNWTIWGLSNDRLMICGNTKDIRELPQVIRGWAEGASLDEIRQAATLTS